MPTETQKWPSHLVLVRHGESERTLWKEIAAAKGELVYGGEVRDPDVKLTERGRQQAIATGKYLAGTFTFDRVFSSPFARTLETADLLMQQFPGRVELTQEERIREIEFGILDGLTKVGQQARHPQEWERRQHLGKYWYRPPGGESYPDVALRLHSFLGTLTRDFCQQSVLVVCHSVIVLLFRRLLERLSERELMSMDANPRLDVLNCSVTHYAYQAWAAGGGKLALREFAGVHYPPELAAATAAGPR
jgi:broad specificity phosphatase PhoE